MLFPYHSLGWELADNSMYKCIYYNFSCSSMQSLSTASVALKEDSSSRFVGHIQISFISPSLSRHSLLLSIRQ